MFGLISLGIAIAAAMFGFWQARSFTQTKLRYVDAVHKSIFPLAVGLLAAVVVSPLVFLPLITKATAVVFGAGVAMGVSSGARDIRKRIGAG